MVCTWNAEVFITTDQPEGGFPTGVDNFPSGTAGTVTATVKKPDGTTDTGYTGKVIFSASNGLLSARDVTCVAGVATVTLTNVAGNYCGPVTIDAVVADPGGNEGQFEEYQPSSYLVVEFDG